MVVRQHWGLGVGHVYSHSARPDSTETNDQQRSGDDIEEETQGGTNDGEGSELDKGVDDDSESSESEFEADGDDLEAEQQDSEDESDEETALAMHEMYEL